MQTRGHLAGQIPAEAHALGDASIFGVIDRGVGDPDVGDWIQWGQAIEKMGATYGLGITVATALTGQDVAIVQLGIDSLQAGDGISDEGFVRATSQRARRSRQ